ncbi:hypothetical protein [Gordonia sp. CPCC 205333]|uniref:hypothetical protein n=1 Tax=Gordonia sp. CPCC 205333 TaxID=3140790 RepID=UPI003AF37440
MTKRGGGANGWFEITVGGALGAMVLNCVAFVLRTPGGAIIDDAGGLTSLIRWSLVLSVIVAAVIAVVAYRSAFVRRVDPGGAGVLLAVVLGIAIQRYAVGVAIRLLWQSIASIPVPRASYSMRAQASSGHF